MFMKQPRTSNGYSLKDILDNYQSVEIGDSVFWEAACKLFGQERMADMRGKNIKHHADSIFQADIHCSEHGGTWTEEDEEDGYSAALFDQDE
jgi:hypothetical protein